MKSKRTDEINRGNRSRSAIKILLLGDDRVGKSSVISTFVSRYFSSAVPGKMTKVRLPPDPAVGGFIITTIMDSQGGDAALLSAASVIESNVEGDVASDIGSTGTSTGASTDSGAGGGRYRTEQVRSVERNVNFGGGIDHVDSIILVYDLGRVETFNRLESHWLPLIEKCYNSKLPVIIAGNKLDLLCHLTDETSRSNRQIIALLQRYKFVRQCIKCSAKSLRNVDEIFLKARQSVLYPITPALYDLEKCCLADDCKRSITRIFRMYDVDNDGLLSSTELNAFQKFAFNVQLKEGDFKGWQKLISRHDDQEVEAVVRDGKFTGAGFMAIFDIFICQNRLDVPWKILRQFGYDDDLNLHIPRNLYKPHVSQNFVGDFSKNKEWKLSTSAKTFLAAIFHQFNSAKDGMLSVDDISKIFWVIPGTPLPPWHPKRAKKLFKRSFSIPLSNKKMVLDDASSPIESDTVPSISTTEIDEKVIDSPVGAGGDCKQDSFVGPLTFNDWMGHWHMISAISPSITRAELYRLGHIENPATIGLFRRDNSSVLRQSKTGTGQCSSGIRIWVIGKRGCGKTTTINYIRSTNNNSMSGDGNTKRDKGIISCSSSFSIKPETSFKCIHKSPIVPSKEDKRETERTDNTSYLILTEIPGIESCDMEQKGRELMELKRKLYGVNCTNLIGCDLIILVFDPTDKHSFLFTKEVEAVVLNEDTPRIFVASANYNNINHNSTETLKMSHEHCENFDLEHPILISIKNDCDLKRASVLETLYHATKLDSSRVIPHREKKRREAQKQYVIRWFGGLLTTSLIAIGVGLYINKANTNTRKEIRLSCWRRFFLGRQQKHVY